MPISPSAPKLGLYGMLPSHRVYVQLRAEFGFTLFVVAPGPMPLLYRPQLPLTASRPVPVMSYANDNLGDHWV